MKHTTNKYRSVLVVQVMLVQIQAIYSIHFTQRSFLLQNGRNTNSVSKEPVIGEINFEPLNVQTKNNPVHFLRKARSANQSQLLNIDLSALRQDKDVSSVHHAISRQRSPVNILGIDISALSRNPDPTLPIGRPKSILNGKSIMSYDFDANYDRLPIIKTKPVQVYTSVPEIYSKPGILFPVMHIPLKVMTTFHSILTNKKQDIDFNFDSSNDIDDEQKHTANFIMQLLHQLSSKHRNVDVY